MNSHRKSVSFKLAGSTFSILEYVYAQIFSPLNNVFTVDKKTHG